MPVEQDSESNRAHRTIVIHPGSSFLRIGRATENVPMRVPHCIARKGQLKVTSPEVTVNTTQIRAEIKTALTEVVQPSYPHLDWTWLQENPLTTADEVKSPSKMDNKLSKPFYFGDEAIEVFDASKDYFLRWPLVKSQFDSTYSLTATLQDLEDLWEECLCRHFPDVSPRESAARRDARCILVIPDIFERMQVRHLAEMVLTRLRFGQLLVHVKSMCASYASIIPTACFVDVGHQQTSITCLHDSSTVATSLVELSMGGASMDALLKLLLPPSLPLAEVVKRKETKLCRVPTSPSTDAGVNSLEMLPSLCLFYPRVLLPLVSRPWMRFRLKERAPQPDDPFEEYYKGKGGRKRRKPGNGDEQNKVSNKKKAVQKGADDEDDQRLVQDVEEEDEEDAEDDEVVLDAPTAAELPTEEETALPALHEAIVLSLSRCPPEVIPAVAEVIVLLGGGASKFMNFAHFLQTQLQEHLRELQCTGQGKVASSVKNVNVDKVRVISGSRGIDAGDLVWKGATLVCTVPCEDLWIDEKAWRTFGSRILRERVPFVW